MNFEDLIKKGESKKLELKANLPKSESLAKTVVAFSNSSGGKIVIGVDDNRKIIGVKENDIFKLEDKISSIIYDLCYPNILPEIYTVNINNKLLLVIEIYRGSLLPYYLKFKGKIKGTYIRIGSTNRLADEDIIMDLERQRIGRTFDESENLEYSIDKLNLNLIYNELSKSNKKADYNKLKNLKLIKTVNNVDVPTNALLIVLGIFDNVRVKCARFKGKTMEEFIDKKEFEGDIFYLLENTINFLKNHLNLHAKINDIKRIEKYEIPIIALREAFLNALIHRDYTRQSDIKVAIYDDIIEIISPGTFPNGITQEDISNGRSELRNKVIANLLKELGYVEIWGSGIAKIKKVCSEESVQFKIWEKGNFVSVEFVRPNPPDYDRIRPNQADYEGIQPYATDYDRIRPVTTKSDRIGLIKKRNKTIIKYLKLNGKITKKEAMKLLQLKDTKIKNILSELVKQKKILRKGKGKNTYYVLNE